MAKPNPTFRAVIERVDGKNRPRMQDPHRYADFLASLKVGETVWWTAILKRPRRSDNQNRYYHMYLDMIVEATGDDHESLHQLFRRKFLPPRFVKVYGEVIKIPTSTTELSKAEFSEYLDRICALTGIPLPDIELAGFIANR